MSNQLSTAHNPEHTATLAEELNKLLADYHLYYMNLRAVHWNVRGQSFFHLHEKFEEYYTEAAAFIDELAERILALGHTPLHTYARMQEHARLEARENLFEGHAAAVWILDLTKQVVKYHKTAIEAAEATGDDVTADLLTGNKQGLEKRAWMLAAYAAK